jgi:FkbM family methyltransferase
LFDVGANNGQTRWWFRNNLPCAKIYSFEPVYSVFKDLSKNASCDSNAVLENIAFGDVPGEKNIRLFDNCSVLNSLKDDLMNNEPEAPGRNRTNRYYRSIL